MSEIVFLHKLNKHEAIRLHSSTMPQTSHIQQKKPNINELPY